MNYKNIYLVLLPALLLTGCGTKYTVERPEGNPPVRVIETPEPIEPVEQPRPRIAPTTINPPVEAVQSLPAAVALRDQAAVATSANDHPRAIGLLERALRISPNDPQTFYELALNHLAMQQPQQALQLARRGLTLNPTTAQRQALERLTARSQSML